MEGTKKFTTPYKWDQQSITPQLVEIHQQQDDLLTANELWSEMDNSVIEEFGRCKKPSELRKRETFLNAIKELLDQKFRSIDLVKMTPDCVLSDGHINLTKLEIVLREIQDGEGED